ncbi:DUF2075 domain-containing protein [Kocuria palustris]|jgi:DUF2075 family protein|uniref:DUF2075 domain-containing protein n=1 Tax=Kocuria palustris TaxID=71999 RepID=UPI0019D26FBC|nr:DUF2075 domain-containing protein [Kocuria palustris]MBN6754013.1 DUF2075 domain-containing protein [Kocuria palustris]MBN6758919.1 DUF2075 domain-containing protein [Kocuria palustris]MBN6764176.1 DUF2075 domain-containing protein [Kocuria palustris]MBN6783417.1 DUF2075 domain-containing protein [Kocuria palustris]MBN6800143.1 DUF2075 domain-containing protein [Kocuria palustris]
MTSSEGFDIRFEIQQLPFDVDGIDKGSREILRFRDWPVVYTLNDKQRVYVGESMSAVKRMRQHLENDEKRSLTHMRLVLSEEFNKSVCLDLESRLIELVHGDGQFAVLNRNTGIVDVGYYMRESYQRAFDEIFEELREHGLLQRSVRQIENTELFKYSPFKSLNHDQHVAVDQILRGLVRDLEQDRRGVSVVRGEPGTGKTIVAMYLLKMLCDIASHPADDEVDPDEMFSEYFQDETRELLEGLKLAFVIPGESLRGTVQKVVSRIPAMRKVFVGTAFQVAEQKEDFDLVVVDEAHRLTQYGAQAHGTLTKKYPEITQQLFGEMDPSKNQLDWLRAKSRMVLLMLDLEQSVRPMDIPRAELDAVVQEARDDDRVHPLVTQMRAAGGNDYIRYARQLVSQDPPERRLDFGDYEFSMYDDMGQMVRRIQELEQQHGLCRMVAGFAWKWTSKASKKGARTAHDFVIDGVPMKWNGTTKDWISSRTSAEEVGSIHTLQGYDLNYAGVIIGPDLRFDPETQRLYVDRAHYHDTRGKASNRKRDQVTTDDDLLRYITNIYAVLLTRGMRGTFVYVCDPDLRRHLERFIPRAAPLP